MGSSASFEAQGRGRPSVLASQYSAAEAIVRMGERSNNEGAEALAAAPSLSSPSLALQGEGGSGRVRSYFPASDDAWFVEMHCRLMVAPLGTTPVLLYEMAWVQVLPAETPEPVT